MTKETEVLIRGEENLWMTAGKGSIVAGQMREMALQEQGGGVKTNRKRKNYSNNKQ